MAGRAGRGGPAGRNRPGHPDAAGGQRGAVRRAGSGGWVRPVFQGVFLRHRRGHHRAVGGLRAGAAATPGGVLRAAAVQRTRHEPDGDVAGAADGVHCAGAAVIQPVCAGSLRAAGGAFQRSGHQVHHHRSAVLGGDAVRVEQHLRRAGDDLFRRDCGGTGDAGGGQSGFVGGHCPAGGGFGVQAVRSAVPHLGAGRLRGGAAAGDGVSGDWLQSGGFRADAAAVRRGGGSGGGLVGAVAGGHRGAGGADDAGGQPGGAGAAEPETAAGVQQHRTRGLRAGRRSGTGQRFRAGGPGGDFLPGGVCGD